MSTLAATNLKHASSASNNIVLDSSGNATFAGTPVPNSSFLRNRIINGDMRIDQRNAGASVSISTNDTSYFPVDRCIIRKNSSATITAQQSATAPTGFKNSTLITVSSGSAVGAGNYFIVGQNIEGFNVADLGFGTASAATITISFWARSSLTGTYNFLLSNNTDNRSYVTTFTINAANTFEYKTITIAGDTAGTWTTDNTSGLKADIVLGAGTTYQVSANTWTASPAIGTSSATNTFLTAANTFYLTGFQLEVGTAATPFERRQYGQELALCQRYYINDTAELRTTIRSSNSTTRVGRWTFPVSMRAAPTITFGTAGTTPSSTTAASTSVFGVDIEFTYANSTDAGGATNRVATAEL